MKSVKPQGFTLVELLVVIGILGILAAALTPAISNAVLQSNMTDVGAKGRDIFVAIAGANSQRKILGLDSIWPKTSFEGEWWSGGSPDISELAFLNSTDYFAELYDNDNFGTENWRPYVVGFDYSKLSGAGVPAHTGYGLLMPENNMWVIAANVRDEMSDIIPILVTRNVDCSTLYMDPPVGSMGEKLTLSSCYSTPFSNTGFVMIRKGGAIFKASAKYATIKVVYQNQSFMTSDWESSADPLTYLDPLGKQNPK